MDIVKNVLTAAAAALLAIAPLAAQTPDTRWYGADPEAAAFTISTAAIANMLAHILAVVVFCCYIGLAFVARRRYRHNPQDNWFGSVNGFMSGFAVWLWGGLTLIAGAGDAAYSLVGFVFKIVLVGGTVTGLCFVLIKTIKTAIKKNPVLYYGASLTPATIAGAIIYIMLVMLGMRLGDTL